MIPLPSITVPLIVGLACLAGGYFWGGNVEQQACELKSTKAENAALNEVRPIEQKAAVEQFEIGKSYVEEKKRNVDNAGAVVAEYRGLRVKSTCSNLPTSAAPVAGTNGTGTADANRVGTSEVDFEDLARQVAKLGLDYDNAITKIGKLQDAVEVYQKACRVE